MSLRLATLFAESGSEGFPNDQERLAWLQEEGAKIAAAYTHPDVTLREMMMRYAIEASTGSTMSRAEGWALASRTLAAAHPDPDDILFGLFIATEVWALGLEYTLADMARFVERLCAIPYDGVKTGDPAQDAYDLYETLLNRMMDLDSMLQGELDDEEIVEWEWSRNPDTLANAMDLLYRCTSEHAERVEDEENREVDSEEFDEIVRWSGHMLWACYHAAEASVPFEELAEFVRMYPDDWSDIFRAVLKEDALAPGILTALSDTNATANQVLENGAEAVALYRADPPSDMTLVEYLNVSLTAAAQDA